MAILFRFNCGNMWGLGHLYRSLALINELKKGGFNCHAIINDNYIAKSMLESKNIRFAIVNEYDSSEELITKMNENFGDEDNIVFWDRLNSESSYIRDIINAGYKIITYDDYDESARMATECIMTWKIPVGGSIPSYSGPRYQLLREEIREYATKEKVINQSVKKILLHFGGTDPLNILILCYNALHDLKDFSLEFIAGKDEPNDWKMEIEQAENTKYAKGVDDFARRLYEADLCLISGGVSMYEAAAIGTPMINISHNKDQDFAASIFQNSVGSVNLGIASEISAHKIKESVLDLCSDYRKRKKMSEAMKLYVPTDGIKIVCKIIESVVNMR
ncbi:hypothetical protein D3Z51_06690 [Clostridiaceae bacterium]|nr:hypothetical protein [Clostridiaceae bacterium]RKI17427.1 hypothetical protein D7V81_02755 [bacterium 1XD21-70]